MIWRRRLGDSSKPYEKDPDYALAHAALAEAWRYLQFFGGARPQDARAKAKNAALKAVALDETWRKRARRWRRSGSGMTGIGKGPNRNSSARWR